MHRVPPGKRALNTHITNAEHAHLKRVAAEEGMTVTAVLRSFIRADMRQRGVPATLTPAEASNAAGRARAEHQVRRLERSR